MKKIDWLILAIPVIILILLIPFLPDKVPMQWDNSGNVRWTMSRYLFPVVGILPFIIYRGIKSKHKK